jgi:hypothetical protein
MNNLRTEQHQWPQKKGSNNDSNLPAIKFNSYSVLRQWLQDDLAESNISAADVHVANINVLCRLRSYVAILDSTEYAIYKQLEGVAEKIGNLLVGDGNERI